MPQIRIVPAIMSGGAGTRLWPASTDARPKQFHALAGTRSLLQDTLARVAGAQDGILFLPPVILANARHAGLVETQLKEIGVGAEALVLEPIGRNTAATAVIAAALALERTPDARVLLLPADHVIADIEGFREAIARAAPFAKDRIVTFGIAPSGPETGYGYIKSGGAISDGLHAIESFREKPDLETATGYLRDGGYSWNAGMFLFDPALLLEEFAAAPEIRDAALGALRGAEHVGARVVLPEHLFAKAPSLPLDIAIMEKTARGAVAPCDIGWTDIGSWSEIWRQAKKDENGNALSGDVLALDAANNLVRANGLRVALAGLNDLVIVAEGDTILILPRDRAQEVKRLWEMAKR